MSLRELSGISHSILDLYSIHIATNQMINKIFYLLAALLLILLVFASLPVRERVVDMKERNASPHSQARFTNNGDGTIRDNATGLIWLKNANCFGARSWNDATAAIATLASGTCGLTDGSIAGSWRLPTADELRQLLDLSQNKPALPKGHLFDDVQLLSYWTSSAYAYETGSAWSIVIQNGYMSHGRMSYNNYAWPVRSACFRPDQR